LSTATRASNEVDFSVAKEDWSRYQVGDGTLIRVRIVVRKITRSIELGPQGYPDFQLESMNAVSGIVPDHLKRAPSTEPWDPKRDLGEEMKFEPLEERWQEYHTTDGFKVLVKPVVMKVWRYLKYNPFGEPIYNLNIQSLVNVERLPSPAVQELSKR
jgi:hypothetical protein